MYRLIIADDEMIECMVLEHIIQNNLKDQIELLDSVQDGVSLLKAVQEKKPDIAIVDINMPGLNGLDAIEILKMKSIKIKIIIHTAYSEFSYAQKALQLGAADYLLKPNMKEEIIETIQKVCKTLDEENTLIQKRAQSNATSQSLYELSGDKWLMSLFLEHPDLECYTLFRRHCPEIAHGGIFTSWKIKNSESLSEKEQETIYCTVKEKIHSFCSSIGLLHKDLFYCLFIPGEKVKHGDVKAWLSKLIEFLCRDWKRKSILFLIGVSHWKEEGDFFSGIYESRIALQHRDQPGLFFFHCKEEDPSKEPVFFKTPPDTARLLLDGRTEECLSHIRQAFLTFSFPSQLSEAEKTIVQKIAASIYLLLLEEELNKISSKEIQKNLEFWRNFQKIQIPEHLLLWVENEIKELYQNFSQKERIGNPYIANASLYISKNYMRDLPLEEVSEAIGISPFYLSRLLKHEKKSTFVEIVTDIRMRKAMLLLAENQKSIREIGTIIGYPNQSYFYKVFKKTTGLALGDIRKYLTMLSSL